MPDVERIYDEASTVIVKAGRVWSNRSRYSFLGLDAFLIQDNAKRTVAWSNSKSFT